MISSKECSARWTSIPAKSIVTQACQKVVATFINQYLFGLQAEESLEVARAIVAANAYILAKVEAKPRIRRHLNPMPR